MTNYNNISIRSAASFRDEARFALKGKWKAALIVGLLLALIGGSIFDASVNLSPTEEYTINYTALSITLGPLSSESYWINGRMIFDLADRTSEPGLVLFSAELAVAAACVAFILLLLQPVCMLGWCRLGVRALQGESLRPGLLRTGWREYWRAVGVLLLGSLYAGWYPMLIILASLTIFIFSPTASLLVVVASLSIIGAVIIWIVREYSYAPALYLMVIQPEKTARELLAESKRIITGHRGQLFGLQLSFFGWVLLLAVVCGIAFGIITALSVSLPVLIVAELLLGLLIVPLTIYRETAISAFVIDRLKRAYAADAEESAPADQPAAIESPESPSAKPEQQQPAPVRQPVETEDDPWSK